jgi:putative thiazole-containing bacteriocin maturation protein
VSRPRLRSDVQFVPVKDGVCFVTNGGPEVFSGKTIYAWVERLAPYLDGRHELDELTSELPPARRAHVESIVAALSERGLVKDASLDRPHDLGDEELERYSAEIAYVESFRDSAAWRFQRFRESRIVVVGAGALFVALVHRLSQSGARRLTAAMTVESTTDVARLEELVQFAGGEAPILQRADDREEGLTRLAAEADLLLHVSDRPMLARARRLDAACSLQATAFIQALVVGDEAWVGPVCSPELADRTWESAWRRHRRPAADAAFVDRSAEPPTEYLWGAAVALVAGVAGLAAFRHLTGVAAAAGTITRVDLATLRTTKHRFLPHPLARPAAPADEDRLLAKIAHLRAGRRVEETDFDRGAMRLVDERLGVFGEISERAFAQVPLSVAAVSVAPAAESGPQPLIVGVGLDSRTARLRAALRGLESYACGTMDSRRLCGQGAASVWGYRLRDGTARPLDARLVFAPAFDPAASPGPGVAAAYSWQDAVVGGLLGQCRRLTVVAAAAGSAVFPRIDLDEVELDDEGSTYRRLLEVVGVDAVAYDVTGGLGVPTVALCSGGRTVAWASALSPEEALCRGLEAVLLDDQARAEGQPEIAPAPVPELPERSRDRSARPPCRRAVVGPDDMVAALTAAGHEPFVVPLDHDPAVADVLPYVVNVVVVDA